MTLHTCHNTHVVFVCLQVFMLYGIVSSQTAQQLTNKLAGLTKESAIATRFQLHSCYS